MAQAFLCLYSLHFIARFQANNQVEVLTWERDRLLKRREEAERENRVREKEHYMNTLAKLRSEGLHRYDDLSYEGGRPGVV